MSVPTIPRKFEWLPAVLAAVAFIGALVVFGWLLNRFWVDIGTWARRDLRSQAELAAGNLREPLESQNFRALTDLHRSLEAKGLILRVRSAKGGWIFHGGYKGATVEEYVPCGEYRVGVAIREGQVYAPFYEALSGFVLAALVGVFGMFAVFFVLYRQRVRIRELARMERFRRDFVSDVSHEIRTPVTGILGAVDLLADEETAAEMRPRLVELVRHSAKRLNALVQSILDLARLERCGNPVRRETVDLGALIGETVDALRPEAENHGFQLVVELPPEGSMQVVCDPQLVAQALENLVVNAVRHSGGSSVLVAVGPAARKGCVRIVVSDDGRGVPEEERERIFERFRRLDAARTEAIGGAGLGLAIARSIARLHGGDVVCRAAKPKGAAFEFDLMGG